MTATLGLLFNLRSLAAAGCSHHEVDICSRHAMRKGISGGFGFRPVCSRGGGGGAGGGGGGGGGRGEHAGLGRRGLESDCQGLDDGHVSLSFGGGDAWICELGMKMVGSDIDQMRQVLRLRGGEKKFSGQPRKRGAPGPQGGGWKGKKKWIIYKKPSR
jgi:hypothetical protein